MLVNVGGGSRNGRRLGVGLKWVGVFLFPGYGTKSYGYFGWHSIDLSIYFFYIPSTSKCTLFCAGVGPFCFGAGF